MKPNEAVMIELKHWRIEREPGGLAWLTFDKAGESTNTLSAEALRELALALDEFEREPPKGLVIRSGKSAGFIAGADIEEFTKVASAADAKALVQRGWDLYNRLAAVKYPTLALVRGHCMGGGTELALACRYRVAVDEPGTRIALPEVMLGIVPGWGGMLRLPQVIGPAAALDMMLTGRALNAKRAKKLGFADECVPPRVMENAARMLALSGQPKRELPFMQKLMNGPLKGFVASQARKQVAKRARPEHYPAPYAILDMWANYGGNALAVPADKPTSMEAIAASPTTKNLVRVYYLQERLKGFGKDSDFAPKHLHVIGAGVMGGDIAAWGALRGLTVTLQDQAIERIAAVIRPHVEDGVGRRVVLGTGALRHLLPRLRGDEALQRAVHQLLHEGQFASRLSRQRQHARGVLHDARRHAFVGETELFRPLRVQRAAAEHHVERGGRADHLRQAQHAAPARHDAEHDLRQGDARARLVHRDAVAAGKRQLGAAAHAMAADQRQRRVLHGGEAVVEVPAAPHQGLGVLGRGDLGEFLDVGANDEAGTLAGADHQALRRLALELVQRLRQFAQRLRRQRVGRLAGLVEDQPGEAAGFALDAPVFEFSHVALFTKICCRPPGADGRRWPAARHHPHAGRSGCRHGLIRCASPPARRRTPAP